MSSQTWTVDRIIKEAAKKGDWHLEDHGLIRRTGGECPISCLMGQPDVAVAVVANDLCISQKLKSDIVDAADNYGALRIRKKMLSAFGLLPAGKEGMK